MRCYSVDRIEKGFAVLIDDDDNIKDVEISEFSFPIKEGMIINFDGENYFSDDQETKKRKKEIINLQNKLFKKK